jgi:hypothetical protein
MAVSPTIGLWRGNRTDGYDALRIADPVGQEGLRDAGFSVGLRTEVWQEQDRLHVLIVSSYEWGGSKVLELRLGSTRDVDWNLEGRAWSSSHLGLPRPPVPRKDLHGVVEAQVRTSSDQPLRLRWLLLADADVQLWGEVEVPLNRSWTGGWRHSFSRPRVLPGDEAGQGEKEVRVQSWDGAYWQGKVDKELRRLGAWVLRTAEEETLARLTFRNGLADGPLTRWWPVGSLRTEGAFEGGLKSGEWSFRDQEGRLHSAEYVKGWVAPLLPAWR